MGLSRHVQREHHLVPRFSGRSLLVLNTVSPKLQDLFNRVVVQFDCTILPDGGLRLPARQRELVATGRSKTIHSKHLTGRAVDVAPWPIDWDDTKTWYAFCGYVKGIAEGMEIAVRGGFDWDRDWMFTDQTFHDLPHWELVND